MTGLLAVATAEALLLVLAAPLLGGLARTLRARLEGRRGPGVLQSYRDLGKLLRRAPVISDDASSVSLMAPALVFGAMVTAAALVPIGAGWGALAFAGDAVALLGVLAAGRFVLALAAFDAGGALAAGGSAREVTIGTLLMPTLMLALVSAGLAAGSTGLGPMAAALAQRGFQGAGEAQVLALAAVALAVLADTGRIPFDDPDTRLELAMTQGALWRDLSGRHLGLARWAADVEQLVLLVLIANIFIPGGRVVVPGGDSSTPAALAIALAIVAGKVVVVTVGYGLVERATARLRFFRAPDLLGVAFAAALVGTIFALYGSAA